MNTELFSELVLRSQSGDGDALEQLLLRSYAPVLYLSAKVLQDDSIAEQVTREVLEIIAGKLHTLPDPDQFRKWMCRITAARCMQSTPLFQTTEPDAGTPWQDALTDGESLSEIQSAEIIQQMVDTLPKSQRLCILLLGCGGLGIPGIARLTGYSDATVTEYIRQGQDTIQRYLWALQARDIEFSGLSSLTGILRLAMFQERPLEEAIPMVYGILGKEIPIPPDPEKRLIRILVILLLVLLLGILAAGGYIAMKLLERPSLPEPTTIPMETTLAPTTEPTQAATVPTTQPETTAAATQPSETETVPETTAPVIAQQTSTGSGSRPAQAPADVPATGEDGHRHVFEKTRSNYNCETGGHRIHFCIHCDYSYEETLAPSGKSHSFRLVPSQNSRAGCETPGMATQICKNCNYASQVADPDKPALGHDYTSTVIAPTATEQGYTKHTCSRCGGSYTDSFVDPIPAATQPPAATEAPGTPEST